MALDVRTDGSGRHVHRYEHRRVLSSHSRGNHEHYARGRTGRQDRIGLGGGSALEEPELLRIPDDELVEPRTNASVLVAGQDEWEQIVSHLVKAGMLEREVEEETLRYRGAPVRNGMFGVHKGWMMREDGTWLRTLRLIVNLIPSNSFQRQVPYRTSEQMGYAPLWGQLYVHESEVVLCCAEDQKQCFHLRVLCAEQKGGRLVPWGWEPASCISSRAVSANGMEQHC